MRLMVAANWKMHFDVNEAKQTAKSMASTIDTRGIDVVICPSFVHLVPIREDLKNSEIKLGAQNMYFEEKGAFTGEVSPLMLLSAGCEYVILGHSERRHIFGEDNQLIAKKVKSAIEHNLKPILCVGETIEERKLNRAFEVVKEQIETALGELNDTEMITIAYEPVWAIGTGIAADVETVMQMHNFIRSIEKDIPILYGGSVKPDNSEELSRIENVNGFLVGSASLSPEKFKQIVETFKNTKGV